jgi:hypothetical protein
MSQEILEAEVSNVVPFSPNLPITEASMDLAKKKRTLLKQFIKAELREKIDYWKAPGSRQESLLKPGAEKLSILFNLTHKIELADKIVDRDANFAMFTYRSTVYHGPSGLLLAQLEGSCNSQEKKYARRSIYKNGDRVGEEETPICDVLNTLIKMAQKRAYVGAVIQAVGASDFYTQDIDDPDEADQLGVRGSAPQRAKVSVPKTTSAKSDGSVEICACGNRMMISKLNEAEWYCVKCKAKKPRE